MPWPPRPHQSFGDALVAARRSLGKQQKQVADEIDVARATLCRWERGNDLPSLRFLWPLAEALNIEPAALLELARTEVERVAS